MPDILIRGMEMPQSCDRCFVKPCKFRALEKRITVQRHPDCPLHELPPHGDLIDRDALNLFIESGACNSIGKALQQIDKMPVIVPSNKGETE